jgi:DNA-binding XRE family transcriptional regulator
MREGIMELKLKAYLANIGMTLKEFAVLVDANPHYLSMISGGKIKPSRRLAKEIEAATHGNVKIEASKKVVGGLRRKTETTATPF